MPATVMMPVFVTVTCSSYKPVCGLNTGAPASTLNCGNATSVCTCEAGSTPVLFVGFGSAVTANAEAMFVNTPTFNARTVKVYFVQPPTGMEAIIGQVIVELFEVPPDEAETKSKFVGRLSDTTMLDATDGPVFVTDRKSV